MNKIFSTIALTLALVLTGSRGAFCQESDSLREPINKIEKQMFMLDILFPGVSYEYRIKKTSSIRLNTRVKSTYVGIIGGSSEPSTFIFHWGYQFGVQFRHYYNMKDRLELGRNVRKNSLNYISLGAALGYGPTYTQPSVSIRPAWGIQRSYNNWYVDAALGANIFVSDRSIPIYPMINISFGYILFKKQ